jgi:hypothetical protein
MTEIIVTKTTTVTKTIRGCINECPYYATEGMERLMICTHPKTPQNDYKNAIINMENGYGCFPEQCPLRQEMVLP